MAYIGVSRALYAHAAPCGRLTGVPGLLQAAGLVPSGDCVVDTRKGGCRELRECKMNNPASGEAARGHCTPSHDRQSCFCVADR